MQNLYNYEMSNVFHPPALKLITTGNATWTYRKFMYNL